MSRHCRYTKASPAPAAAAGADDELDLAVSELLLAEHTITERDEVIKQLQTELRAEQEGRTRDRLRHEEIVERLQADLAEAHGERMNWEADAAASDARLAIAHEDLAQVVAIVEAELPGIVLHVSTPLGSLPRA